MQSIYITIGDKKNGVVDLKARDTMTKIGITGHLAETSSIANLMISFQTIEKEFKKMRVEKYGEDWADHIDEILEGKHERDRLTDIAAISI